MILLGVFLVNLYKNDDRSKIEQQVGLQLNHNEPQNEKKDILIETNEKHQDKLGKEVNTRTNSNSEEKIKGRQKKIKNDKSEYTYKTAKFNAVGNEIQSFEQFKKKYFNSLNKDVYLKYYSKLLLNSMGYYCDMEVNMVTQSFNQKYKKEQISDIDVLGCKIENDLSIELIPVECKSGEGGALDELLKLKGIMDYLGSHRGYLIKTKIANNAREMGENINISTLDITEMRNLLNNLGLLDIKNEKWIETQINNYLHEKYLFEKAAGISKAVEYLKNDYWHQKNFRNIHNIIFLASNITDSNFYLKKEGKYTLMQLSKYLSISIIRLASFVIHKNYANPLDKIREYIFGGARERREREILFDKVNQVLALPQEFEPKYIQEFSEVCLRFIYTPGYGKDVPKCFEYCIKAFILENAGYDKEKLINTYNNITLKLMKDVFVFLCKQARIGISNFSDILNL